MAKSFFSTHLRLCVTRRGFDSLSKWLRSFPCPSPMMVSVAHSTPYCLKTGSRFFLLPFTHLKFRFKCQEK